ncbi:MAG: ATP-binding protein [Chitinophagales bacterium]|nr:ATP-binding protein [Chitinophagales bacterium]
MSSAIKIASEPQNIAQVESFIDDVCKQYNVSEESYGNILISLTEAANNAIIHGNKSNRNKEIEIIADFDNERRKLTFFIKDSGNGFDYKSLPDPTAPENLDRPCGRGVFLMMQLADLVIFSDNGSTVEMQFRV